MPHDNSEQKRLQCLKDLEIMDSDSEQCFDDIANLASLICNTPIALISLLDDKRQWFKARHGLDVCETPIEYAFCAHALKEDKYLLVHNPLVDERFKNNPLVTDGIKVRFYLGIPLKTKSGTKIGTLCVIDTRPRDLNTEQVQAMMRLANQAEHLLFLRMEIILHKKTKNELKKSEEWSHIIFNNSTDMMGIVKVDSEERWPLQAVNPAFCTKIKTDVKYILNEPVAKIISPDLLDKTIGVFKKVIADKTSIEFESSAVRDNEKSYYESIISPKMNENGDVTHLLIISRDITERKKNEEVINQQNLMMAKTSKFSELGELAGSMAHEINNPLTVIISRTNKMKNQIMKMEYDQEVFLKGITQVNETALRIAKIIRGLKSISRNADFDPMVSISLKSVIDDAIFLCEERLRTSEIALTIEYPENSPIDLDARPPQLTQVLMNLINNSVYAISSLNEKWININISQNSDGQKLIIRTTDSGAGISQDLQKKIMEPFFTTKEFGKGTGLGLSISRGIIEGHRGRFYYDNLSLNTSFVIEIPRRQKNHDKIPA